jgi:hypothetical protein
MFWSSSVKNFKPFVFAFSLTLNGAFTALFVLASLSESSSLFFHSPQEGYVTAAAVVSVPKESEAVFDAVSVFLKPYEKAFLQLSFVSSKKQADLLIDCLYDPDVISDSKTGFGIEITALAQGSTLMQAVTNGGIRNIAFIEVSQLKN